MFDANMTTFDRSKLLKEGTSHSHPIFCEDDDPVMDCVEMLLSVLVLNTCSTFIKITIGSESDIPLISPQSIGLPPVKKRRRTKKHLQCEELYSIHCTSHLLSNSTKRRKERLYISNSCTVSGVCSRNYRRTLAAAGHRSRKYIFHPLFNLPSAQRALDELVFEDLGFRSLFVADSPSLVHLYEASRRPEGLVSRARCSLVVDCGFSFTHAAPVLQNFTVNYGVKRLDLGGKALTNYLKELVSYRSVNVMDETLIMDDVKEKLCFVSLDVPRDLRIAWKQGKSNKFKCTYVLPDGVTHTKGFVKDWDEAKRYLNSADQGGSYLDATEPLQDTKRNRIDLAKNEFNLTNERFLVPEMLFRPADLGMNQAGLAECIVRAVNSCHPNLHPVLYESIILTGGSTLFPQFAERLYNDLRPLVPDHYQVKITKQEDPMLGVWRGGSLLASSPDFESMCVTKAEYEEFGSARCRRRFFH
ncbi:hypothetical protein Sjap_011358 [Stephania japonica]|uniref:Actin-related protein 6 n=1 Tax=Stephania japonica TaxID=461633 RepID=A0AAP0P811_9MAGN